MNAMIDVQRLKATINIVDVARRLGFRVTQRGTSTKWTTEEHDSLVLFPKDNSWHRFSSGDGGDVIDFVRYWKHCDFVEACAWLDSASVANQPRTPAPEPPPSPKLPQDLHLRYHNAMNSVDWEWWSTRYGISDAAIARFCLGVCRDGRFAPVTYTIPVIASGALVNIKHRIPQAEQGSKYRNHQAGVGSQLFNGDRLSDARGVVIVAGELKVITLEDYGIPAVSGTAGCGAWRPDWTEKLAPCDRIYICFDPEPPTEQEHARKLAGTLGARARIVECPAKPDDYILTHGANAFRNLLKQSKTLDQIKTWEAALERAKQRVRV